MQPNAVRSGSHAKKDSFRPAYNERLSGEYILDGDSVALSVEENDSKLTDEELSRLKPQIRATAGWY